MSKSITGCMHTLIVASGLTSPFLAQINTKNLKERACWACGWLQREQLDELDAKPQQVCKACTGSGIVQNVL